MRALTATFVFVLGFSLFVCAQEEALRNRPGLSLRETFDLYIDCIDATDLEGMMSTVTGGPEFVFLTTSGSIIDSVEGYHQFHVEWIAEKGWEITFEILAVHDGTDLGFVLSRYHYEGLTPDGEPYSSDSYFTLIFHREDGMWKAIQDQITPIRTGQ